MPYSQSTEESFILEYFGGHIGSLLDIGANDGRTLSNSLALIERGWFADLVEPSPQAFWKLTQQHQNNNCVSMHPLAIADADGEVVLYESGPHLNNGDVGLLSTTKREELERWTKEEFKPVKVPGLTFNTFLSKRATFKLYDFISIDAEGLDVAILRQINLHALSCNLLCIEWNGNARAFKNIVDYCFHYGLFVVARTPENLILGNKVNHA